jgi:hypothetical protein
MGIKQKILSGLKNYWINVFYITLVFSVFSSYRRLILAHYQISYENYGISLINGLILAKVILVAEHLHIGRGFEDRPLAVPVLYKSFLFTVCVMILSIAESNIRGFWKAKACGSAFDTFLGTVSYEWLAGMLAVFVIFIPFFAIRELERVLGSGKISKLFFQRREGAGPEENGRR